ncbi:glycosyltransferase family 4 protein [Lacibacterium aquatile]|uniref:Glycosyltransferase family 4 protein n=1 Tax=Lacibacterium aquatile TaxID=1168082 RepID=A0ABW5DRP6_9PROT
MTPATLSPVAFVLKGYPRLSETFIAQEILALEKAGLPITIVSLRRPTDKKRHPIVDEIRAPLLYLPEYLHEAPGKVLKSWWKVRRLPGYSRAFAAWIRDFKRDPTSNRGRRWGQALVLAAELPDDIARIHAHFMHTPGSVARYAAMIRGLPFSFSAHAKDIWTIPEWEKRDKLADAQWAVTCTGSGADHLHGLSPADGRVSLVYHGLDFSRFPHFDSVRPSRDGSGEAVQILSVGRLVAKKGYDDLLDALARLPTDLNWRFSHIGGGDGEGLRAQADRLGIADRIEWRGAQSQADVLEALRSADLFVLASRVTDDGDRDGLPNVLMEAQSQALACVSTNISAIPELIRDGETGLLVPPQDAAALSIAIEALIRDPQRRLAIGAAGEARVRGAFGHEAGVQDLLARFSAP